MKYLSLFSGIGTAEMGIEQAYAKIRQIQQDNGNDGFQWNTESHRSRPEPHCIGFAEIDRFASSIYKYHWPDVRNYGDATKIICDELPDFDFLVGGFPCQAFSIAGKRKGFQDTRGTLFFEIARILESKRPRHFLLENVAGLLSHDNGQTFRTIIATLDEIGYDTEWTLINSKHHGVPQNRERVFFIGHSSGCGGGEILSFGDGDGEFDEEYGDAAYCLDANYAKGCNDLNKARRTVDNGSGSVTNEIMQLNDPTHSNNRVYSQGGSSPALNTAQGGNRQPFVAIPVLTPDRPTKRQNGRRMKEQRIRRLTEIECERLQGLPDNFTALGRFDDGIKPISSTQRYKTLGNAMTVNVIEAIVTRMIQVGCLDGNEEAHRTNVLPVV